MHCAKAFRRSTLWDPDQLQERSDMPSLNQMILDQTSEAPDDPEQMRKLDAALEDECNKTMH